MLQKYSGIAALAVLVGSLVAISPSLAAAQSSNPNTNPLAVPITGTATDAANVVANLTGTLAISRFAVQNGTLMAVGTLTATITDAAGTVLRTFVSNVAVPVVDADGTCDILNLDLGPLDLNLLGLQIHLNQVVLDIVAQTGAGNLLGNLLCAIAGLLDGGVLGGQLVTLLNQLLGALAGI
jgi:hypothetical protein